MNTPQKCILTAAVAAFAGSANAALFSFASDSTDHSWVFSGSGGNIVDASGPANPVTLMIDDNNGPLPVLNVSTQFNANMTLTFSGDVNLGGGAFSHNYLANGTFSFIDPAAGVTLLTVTFQNALFTARGGQTSWATTASLQADNSFGATVNMTWNGANLPGYGLAPGALSGNRGFSFGIDTINTSGALPYGGQNPGVALGAGSLPNATWFAESSFAGSNTVPTPGAISVLALSGLAAFRRRR